MLRLNIIEGRHIKRHMKYFDTHIHFFPDKLAPRALEKLMGIAQSPCYSAGTRDDTLNKQEQWARDTGNELIGLMLLSVATNERQQTSVNNFAKESQGGKIYSFGSVYPTAENALDELRRIKEMGLFGVKFHPDYQNFTVDDERVFPVYAEAEHLGLPVAFHTGRDPLSPDLVHCEPKALSKVAEAFPKLTIIAAHMGGMEMAEDAAKYLAGKRNVYFDTAYASRTLNAKGLTGLIKLHGADRVLFATDCPWSTVPTEWELLKNADISEEEREMIAWKNAVRLFKL